MRPKKHIPTQDEYKTSAANILAARDIVSYELSHHSNTGLVDVIDSLDIAYSNLCQALAEVQSHVQ